MSSSQLTLIPSFFRGVGQPPTRLHFSKTDSYLATYARTLYDIWTEIHREREREGYVWGQPCWAKSRNNNYIPSVQMRTPLFRLIPTNSLEYSSVWSDIYSHIWHFIDMYSDMLNIWISVTFLSDNFRHCIWLSMWHSAHVLHFIYDILWHSLRVRRAPESQTRRRTRKLT